MVILLPRSALRSQQGLKNATTQNVPAQDMIPKTSHPKPGMRPTEQYWQLQFLISQGVKGEFGVWKASPSGQEFWQLCQNVATFSSSEIQRIHGGKEAAPSPPTFGEPDVISDWGFCQQIQHRAHYLQGKRTFILEIDFLSVGWDRGKDYVLNWYSTKINCGWMNSVMCNCNFVLRDLRIKIKKFADKEVCK